MNRRNKILIGVLVAQILLIVIGFVSRSTPAGAQSAPLLGNLKAADVVGMTLQDNTGKAITLTQQSGAWIVPALDNYPVPADKMSSILDKLIAVKTDALETKTSAAHKQLQVADDTYTRKIDLRLADGSTQTLYVGTAPSASAAHVRVAGQDNVYLARTFSSFDLSPDITAWIETVYLNVASSDILTATLKNAAGMFNFVLDPQNQWTLQGLSASEKFNPDSVVTLLAHLTNLQMIAPLGKTAKPEYGMDKPSAVLTIESKTSTGVKTTILTIGAKDPTDSSYVIISSDSPYYVRTSQFNVDEYATKTRDGFLILPPTPIPAPTLTSTVGISGTIEPGATATITATTPTTPTK
jgi:Domain of unknown function (DUF4340)